MARKPEAGSAADPRRTIIEALLALATEKSWSEFGLPEVAEKAGLTLGELRGHFPSRGAILSAFVRQTDIAVLDGVDKEMADEPARERLFDVLMQRLAVLKPHRAAVASVAEAFRHDPLALAAWNKVMVGSMQWMLMAARIGAEGPAGALRAQGLALAWSQIIKVWVKDEDPGIARTMTEIDRQLRAGERWIERADDLFSVLRPFQKMAERARERRSRLRERLRDRFRDFTESGRRRSEAGPDAEAM